MRVLILGATGRTGRELVRQALARGLHVTAFGRAIERLPPSGAELRVVRGDVADAAGLASAIEGQDAVISALGVARTLSADPVVVAGIRHTLDGMRAYGVRRLIYLSFIGVRESRPAAGLLIRHVVHHVLRHEIADHEIKERAIRDSETAWTIVRAPKLTDGPFTGRYRDGETIVARSAFPTLARADVADFMLRQLTDDRYVRRAPRILP